MEIRKKTTATLLIAILMTSAFAVAPIMAAPSYYTEEWEEKGLIDWTNERANSGSYSIRLELSAPFDWWSEAKVVFSHDTPDTTLSTLSKVSYYAYMEGDSGFFPRIYCGMDRDGDTKPDAWIVLLNDFNDCTPPLGCEAPDTWYSVTLIEDDTSMVKVLGDGKLDIGDGFWPGESNPISIGELKKEFCYGDRTWGDLEILKIRIGLMLNTDETVDVDAIAFVDDVTINDVTYDFEPEPDPDAADNKVSLTATIDPILTLNIVGSGTVFVCHGTPSGSNPVTPATPSSYAGPGTYQLTYPEGTIISLVAGWTDPDFIFGSWDGDVEPHYFMPDEHAVQVTLDGHKTATATFLELFDMTLDIVGQGTVEVVIVGGNPGEMKEYNGPDTYTLTFLQGTKVSMKPVSDYGWEFGEWTGDGKPGIVNLRRVVTMDADKTVTATFLELFDLTVNIEGGGEVKWNVIPQPAAGGTFKESTNTETFPDGTVIRLVADPDSEWWFDEWTGDYKPFMLIGVDVTLDADKIVTAIFIPKVVSIHVTPDTIDFGSPMPGQTATDEINVLNNGNTYADVTAALEGTDSNFYATNMLMDSTSVSDWIVELDPTDTGIVSLSLTIPNPSSPGTKIATLVFDAVESP